MLRESRPRLLRRKHHNPRLAVVVPDQTAAGIGCRSQSGRGRSVGQAKYRSGEREEGRMAEKGSILVTGAAGQLGAVGRTVTGLLLERGIPVRALVRREDDRAAALRAAGAEVVVGDLLEPADVYPAVRRCRPGHLRHAR